MVPSFFVSLTEQKTTMILSLKSNVKLGHSHSLQYKLEFMLQALGDEHIHLLDTDNYVHQFYQEINE